MIYHHYMFGFFLIPHLRDFAIGWKKWYPWEARHGGAVTGAQGVS